MNPSSQADAGTIAAAIGDLKQSGAHDDDFPLPLIWRGRIIGHFRPLGYVDANDVNLLTHLQNWRNRHRTGFFTQFEATLESTRNWLSTLILDRPDRILFLITDETNRPIGQCGACNIHPDSAELDAVMRGERLGHPMLMVLAERALLRWIFDGLRIGRVYTRVFGDNVSTIRLFLSIGLTIGRWETFRMITEGAFTRHEPASNFESESGRKVAHLELSRDRFCASAT